jgi:thioesterase domain-containing protein
MSETELQHYLHTHIPLSKAMQVEVQRGDIEGVTIAAPLAPNINHRDTVFGGSAVAVAILAAWSLLHLRLRADGVECRLVIQRNEMQYELPIVDRFTAQSQLAAPADWPKFLRVLARKGRARIAVAVLLECNGQVVGRMQGDFVAIGGGEG